MSQKLKTLPPRDGFIQVTRPLPDDPNQLWGVACDYTRVDWPEDHPGRHVMDVKRATCAAIGKWTGVFPGCGRVDRCECGTGFDVRGGGV